MNRDRAVLSPLPTESMPAPSATATESRETAPLSHRRGDNRFRFARRLALLQCIWSQSRVRFNRCIARVTTINLCGAKNVVLGFVASSASAPSVASTVSSSQR
uniref:Uncharacterized protein n=1 Tax=Plectus sambesii TaxID=2011161 RepID=A0A914WZK1_9BILA